MTYNDGVVQVYRFGTNAAEQGNKPKKGLIYVESFFYGYETLGFNRYYTALAANQQIEAVIRIPEWNELDPAETVLRLENGKDYRIVLVQPTADERGEHYTRLSLERIHESYDIIGN